MSELLTFAAQRRTLDALVQIAEAFGHLPAANFELSRIYPDRLVISMHDSLDAFEQWRAALGIPADAATYRELPGDMMLMASGELAGATVELVGYAPALPKRVAQVAGGAA